MRQPTICPACRSLVGCKGCVEEWAVRGDPRDTCPKCREAGLMERMYEVTGLEDIFDIHRDNVRE